MQMLEDAKVRFVFVDIEDTTSPRMSQLLALSNDKELPQLFVEGVVYVGKSQIRRYIES
jgi:glutaredoxin-related protein